MKTILHSRNQEHVVALLLLIRQFPYNLIMMGKDCWMALEQALPADQALQAEAINVKYE